MGGRKKVEIQVHLAGLFKGLVKKVVKLVVKMKRDLLIFLFYPCDRNDRELFRARSIHFA